MIKKLLYVLLDGVGDRPVPSLGNKTPLEVANTPHLDSLAKTSVSGLVYTVGKGIAPESDIAVFSMLGYSFEKKGYMGRGVVEAVGAGLDFENGDLALRANFATVREDFTVVDRRAGRNLKDKEGKILASALKEQVKIEGVEIEVVHTVSHRVVVKFRREGGLSANISNTDPAYQRIGGMGIVKTGGKMRVQPAMPLDDDPKSKVAADIVNEFTRKAHDVLKNHSVNRRREEEGKLPANILLMRDAGNYLPELPTMYEKYGLSFSMIADMPVELGIGRIAGMNVLKSKGVNDYSDKVRKVKDELRSHDALYIHIKGPDEPGHDGKAGLKVKVIEEIDDEFFKPVIEEIWDGNMMVVVSADHATPCTLKAHSDDPVPVIYSAKWIKGDGTARFTEREASKGMIGMMMGIDVLTKARKLLTERF